MPTRHNDLKAEKKKIHKNSHDSFISARKITIYAARRNIPAMAAPATPSPANISVVYKQVGEKNEFF